MVVKSELKLIKSLQQKKYRNAHGLFVMEGKKAIEEVVQSGFEVYSLFSNRPEDLTFPGVQTQKITSTELKHISSLKNPNGYLGVFHIPTPKQVKPLGWILALDGVQDPGNLGTIIRLCDWFGIDNLVCSLDTVDCFNPKVLQATMGSITRVNIVYENLSSFLSELALPIFGAFMDGANVTRGILPTAGVLVMGNEGKGISDEIERLCTDKVSIQQFGEKSTESLNVAMATSILLHEIRR